MMAGIFILWLVTLCLAWVGRERHSAAAFLISLLASVAMFVYHATDAIQLDL